MKKILMASITMTVFAVSVLLFQLTSCKKAVAQVNQDCPKPTYPVAGLYTGTYSVNFKPGQGNLYYSLVVFPDGTLLTKGLTEFGDTAYSKGNWALSSDSVFTAAIETFAKPSVFQTITGIFSNDGKISNATWEDIYHTGNFSVMQRVNQS